MRIAFLTAGGIAPCLSASIGALIEKYNQISTWFKSHDASFWQEYSSQIVKHTMLLAAIFLLDAIILPIASLLFIWNLLKRFFSWLLDFSVLLN